MRRYVIERLRWRPEQWKEVWELRNLIFHGSHDLSWEEQQKIIGLLRPLEMAVVAALRGLLKLPQDAPPSAPRRRGWGHGAVLHTTWTPPDKPGEPTGSP